MHTLGPWEVIGWDICAIDTDVDICTMSDIHSVEDAQLIAAAPDLLFELKTITAVLKADGRYACFVPHAEAAINKAEGRTL